MLSKIKQIQTAMPPAMPYGLIAYTKSENYGDFAILKADILGAKASPEVADQLTNVVGYYPKIDLDELIQYPPGTFGREYAEHMKLNHLKSLNISPELEEVAKRNVFALRYVITHDIFHVLLGFDTSYAGEIGVLSFAAAQDYSKSQKISLILAKLLYPVLAPTQIKAIFTNLKKGRELGEKAEFLLGYRFEEHWKEPIDRLRNKLGLPQISLAENYQHSSAI